MNAGKYSLACASCLYLCNFKTHQRGAAGSSLTRRVVNKATDSQEFWAFSDQTVSVSSFDPTGRELLGWIDTSGYVMRTKHDIIKSSWNQHLCYIPFVGSLNLHCPLSNPIYIKLFPQSFGSLEGWQRARSIMETNVSTLEQHIKKNRPSWLKLPFANRVR